MPTKISDTPIGARVLDAGKKVADLARKERSESVAEGYHQPGDVLGPGDAPRVPSAAIDGGNLNLTYADLMQLGNVPNPMAPPPEPKVELIPTTLSPAMEAQTRELKEALDNVRAMLGQGAVTELMAELPKAAVEALEQLSPGLPVAPGEHPLMAFKKKFTELVAAEQGMHARARAFNTAARRFAWEDSCKLKDGGNSAFWVQTLPTSTECRQRNVSDYSYRSAVEEINRSNSDLRELWPDIPSDLLLKLPHDPNGPGLTVDKLVRQAMGSSPYARDRVLTVEKLRTLDPKYQQLRRDVMVLEHHLREEMFPTPEKVTALKAQLLDPDVPVSKLYEEATALIAKVEAMADGSEIKRETLNSTGESTSSGHSSGMSVSHSRDGSHPLFSRETGMTVTHSSGSSSGSSKSSGTTQVLNMAAKSYTIVQVPNGEDSRMDELSGRNFVSPFESELLMERLLAARRIFEGMRAREPDSPYTRALQGWMEESTFDLVQLSAGPREYSGLEEEELGQIKTGDLRPDILAFAQAGHYPEDRVDLLKEELTLGPIRAPSSLGLNL